MDDFSCLGGLFSAVFSFHETDTTFFFGFSIFDRVAFASDGAARGTKKTFIYENISDLNVSIEITFRHLSGFLADVQIDCRKYLAALIQSVIHESSRVQQEILKFSRSFSFELLKNSKFCRLSTVLQVRLFM